MFEFGAALSLVSWSVSALGACYVPTTKSATYTSLSLFYVLKKRDFLQKYIYFVKSLLFFRFFIY